MGPVLVVLVLMLGAAEAATLASCMPGGLVPVSTDDPGVLNASRQAEEWFNRRMNAEFYSAVSNVKSAQAQVVEGLMYHLTLVLRTTVCRKAEPRLQDCPFHQDPQYAMRSTCKFTVWYRPWLGSVEVSSTHCSGVGK